MSGCIHRWWSAPVKPLTALGAPVGPDWEQASACGRGDAGNFGGNRHEFAAMESEVAQHARIEGAQRGVGGSRALLAFPPDCHSAHDVTGGPHRRFNNLPQVVRARARARW